MENYYRVKILLKEVVSKVVERGLKFGEQFCGVIRFSNHKRRKL